MSELRAFLEADISNMEPGSACLAKHEDGIWYPARISGATAEIFQHHQLKTEVHRLLHDSLFLTIKHHIQDRYFIDRLRQI